MTVVNLSVAIVVGAKSEELADPIRESLNRYTINVYDGSRARSFAQLLNEIIYVSRETDIVVFCSHKVRPTDDDIKLIIDKVVEGYGLVMLYKMACFGFRPELFRRIGMFDERFEPAGYEDNDIYIRLMEADISVYEETRVEYVHSRSTWQQELVEVEGIEFKQPKTFLFYSKKWRENMDRTVTRRMLEGQLCYNMGNINRNIKFKRFDESVIESSHLFPMGVRNEIKIENKRWLIIGGTGSLGKKVMDIYGNSNQIHVMSRDENKHWELKDKYKGVKFMMGDIRDYEKVNDVINRVSPNIIVIAAALKHIDTCEYELKESLETNTMGTMNVLKSVRSSKLKDLETVLFVSTDKACYPINTYGMCKALSEKAIVEESLKMCDSHVKYVNIRYGNVLDSRGSIIPKLREWKGDTYYLTHLEMTRFLMTQEDSVELMTYAIMSGESGDTIVPKIDAMSIKELFELYNESSGGGKKIEITKLRAGEKMHESLLNVNEIRRTVRKVMNDKEYYIIKPDYNLDNYRFVDMEEMKSYDSCDALLSKERLCKYLEEKGFLESMRDV